MSLILSVIVLKTLLIAIILNIKDINNCNIEERHEKEKLLHVYNGNLLSLYF